MVRMSSISKAVACGIGLALILASQASGQTWSQLSPSGGPPAPRSAFGSVFDLANDRMIIFGGSTSNPTPPSIFNTNDVWVLTNADGVGDIPQWTELSPTADPTYGLPYPRHGNVTVYDPSSNRMIIFGGCLANCTQYSPPSPANDVWVLTNANGLGGTPVWTELFPTGGPPAPRGWVTGVYDPGTNGMIVFGGSNGFISTYGDVWVLSNANGLGGAPAWTELSPTGGPPEGQANTTAVYDPINNRLIVFGGYVQYGGISNAAWVLSNANGQGGTPAWTNLTAEGASGSPPPRYTDTAVYDQSSNRMIIFGGANGGTQYNDTWLLTNANGLGGTPVWMELTPSGGPPAARTQPGSVFNPASDRMLILDGWNSTGWTPDAWVLTNANGLTGPAVSLSTSTLSFGSQQLGGEGGPQPVTLTNTGSTTLNITSIAASGDFFQTNTCGTSVNAGAACTIDVTFAPAGQAGLGAQTGSISITDNAAGSPQSISLSGVGIDTIPPAISIAANPSTLWPPNGKSVPVTVSGVITDSGSGVNPSTLACKVVDEYGLDQPPCSVGPLGGGGAYSFTTSLVASRDGNDKNGRTYTILVSASDYAGNPASAATTVLVPHDQGQ